MLRQDSRKYLRDGGVGARTLIFGATRSKIDVGIRPSAASPVIDRECRVAPYGRCGSKVSRLPCSTPSYCDSRSVTMPATRV